MHTQNGIEHKNIREKNEMSILRLWQRRISSQLTEAECQSDFMRALQFTIYIYARLVNGYMGAHSPSTHNPRLRIHKRYTAFFNAIKMNNIEWHLVIHIWAVAQNCSSRVWRAPERMLCATAEKESK